MENNDIFELASGAWREKVCIETEEYFIKGYVYMPKIGKRNRLISEILNSKKPFIAVKNCSVESKLNPQQEIKNYEFIQVNMLSILIMRPLDEN